MLEFIHIQRFKTLLDANFPCSQLCLFSGLNGMGKSSLIQTLLLLRQSYEKNTLFSKGLLLKGDYITLGTGQDVLSADADENTFSFNLRWKDSPLLSFKFEFVQNSDLQPIISSVEIDNLDKINLFNKNFQYLSAERVSSHSIFDTSDYNIEELNSIGNHGEYAAYYIAENASRNIPIPALKHKQSDSLSFSENLNCWMSEISPGVRISADVQRKTNTASLSYSFIQGKDVTTEFKPQNVGFGLTYVLPVIVTLLRSKPGDLVIIENPESHLHPAGQAALGKLCALVASQGVQLLIESHSDHFLNGIRVAVKEQIIQPDNVSIFFLERMASDTAHASTVIQPKIDSYGRLNQWPEGFFDEWDKQLEKLL